jgi:hypothetical protein
MPPRRLGCRELKNLSKPPTPLRSVNVRPQSREPAVYLPLISEQPKSQFRRTTPGSAVVLVTKYTSQPPSQLLDPKYPGAHLPLTKRHALAPRWKSPHLTLHAFPKAFLTKPEVRYREPHELRPYPARWPQAPGDRSADMSLQVLLVNSRVMLRATLRSKIKRRLREAVRLIVTRGAAVEESRKGPKVVFREEDVGSAKWIAPGMCCRTRRRNDLRACCSLTMRLFFSFLFFHADWTYVALPTTEVFRMSFAELINTMRQALQFLHRCIPEAERILRHSGRQIGGAASLVRVLFSFLAQKSLFL